MGINWYISKYEFWNVIVDAIKLIFKSQNAIIKLAFIIIKSYKIFIFKFWIRFELGLGKV